MDTCPIFVLADFKIAYPEIAGCFTDDQIQAAYLQANALYRGFGGLCDSQRLFATWLAVAHTVTLRFDPRYVGGTIRSMKTRNDEIGYAVSGSGDSFNLTSTSYGSQLKKMLRFSAVTGFVSEGWSWC